MGVYASSFPTRGDRRITEFTDPSQANWITTHSEACGMTLSEVQRCWRRCVALGADKSGNIPRQSLITDDPLSAQLVQQLPDSGNGLVTFQTYCNAVNWLAKSTVDDKLRGAAGLWDHDPAVHLITGLYQTLSFSRLDQGALRSLLSILYPEEPPEYSENLAALVMREIDVKKQGLIDEAQFIWWMHRLPPETLKSLLHFPLLPDSTGEQAPTKGDLLKGNDLDKVTDGQLHWIAMEMAKRRRDWRLLANCLGFLEVECQAFERQHQGEEKQVLAFLQHWGHREGNPATMQELQTALRDSGNTDIKNIVFRLTF